jgi:hypothetical protein
VQRPASGFLISFQCRFQSHGSGLVRAEKDGQCYTGEQSVALNCVRFKAAQVLPLSIPRGLVWLTYQVHSCPGASLTVSVVSKMMIDIDLAKILCMRVPCCDLVRVA